VSEDMLNVMGSFISTELDAFENLHKELEEKDKEIEKLNNIINELEKYLIEQVEKSYSNDYDNVLDKLDELKGEDKE